MNYLAHAFLADTGDEFLIGSLLGDLVKGKPQNRYNHDILEGIIFHRKVDTYADHHRMTLASKKLFSGPQRRYAGIILDIFYDHFLSKHWKRYGNKELTDFTARVYAILQNHYVILPKRLKEALPRMVEQNWLASYVDLAGVEITLERISRRLRNGTNLRDSIEEIKIRYDSLEKNSHVFFQDLISYCADYLVSIRSRDAAMAGLR